MQETRERMIERLQETTRTVTPLEVSQVLGRAQRTVYDMANRGAFGDVEIGPGGRITIPYEGVEIFIRTGGGAVG